MGFPLIRKIRRSRSLQVVAAAAVVLTLAACKEPAADGGVSQPGAQPPSPTLNAAEEQAMDTLVANIIYRPMLQEIETFWEQIYYAQTGVNEPSDAVAEFLTGDDNVVCGAGTIHEETITAQSGVGPVYCFDNDTIAVPTAFTRKLVDGQIVELGGQQAQISPAGNVGVFFLLAHEWGHNVQSETLTFAVINAGIERQLITFVDLENHADCLAGVAIAGVPRVFEVKDVEAILTLAQEIGEPEIPPSATPGPQAHGTSQQRMDALSLGMFRAYDDQLAILRGITDCFEAYLTALLPLMSSDTSGQ